MKLVVYAFCGILLALYSSPDAQPATKTLRLGILEPGGSTNVCNDGVRQGLRTLGYVENQNLVMEARHAEWKPERLQRFASELAQLSLTRSGLMDRAPFVRSNGPRRQFRSLSAFLALW